jgi:hypothetical protein
MVAPSVVVRDLHVAGISEFPPEADAPLIVDTNAVLACSRTRKSFQPIARRNSEVLDRIRGIQKQELPMSSPLHVGWKPLRSLSLEDPLGLPITKASNHG